jgi:toxin tx1
MTFIAQQKYAYVLTKSGIKLPTPHGFPGKVCREAAADKANSRRASPQIKLFYITYQINT